MYGVVAFVFVVQLYICRWGKQYALSVHEELTLRFQYSWFRDVVLMDQN